MMSLHTAKLCDIESYLDSLHIYYHPKPLSIGQRFLIFRRISHMNIKHLVILPGISSLARSLVLVLLPRESIWEQSSPNSVSVNTHGVLIKEDLR